jgi:hypothetical protein
MMELNKNGLVTGQSMDKNMAPFFPATFGQKVSDFALK